MYSTRPSGHSKREKMAGFLGITLETLPTRLISAGLLTEIVPFLVLYHHRLTLSSTKHQAVSVFAEHIAFMNCDGRAGRSVATTERV